MFVIWHVTDNIHPCSLLTLLIHPPIHPIVTELGAHYVGERLEHTQRGFNILGSCIYYVMRVSLNITILQTKEKGFLSVCLSDSSTFSAPYSCGLGRLMDSAITAGLLSGFEIRPG